MKKHLFTVAATAALAVVLAGSAMAWTLCGRVLCDDGTLPVSDIVVQVTSSNPAFTGSAVTGDDGAYCIVLPDGNTTYVTTLILYNGETVISPASGSATFTLDEANPNFTQDWIINAPNCGQKEGACWLTGGGAKFSPLADLYVGDAGKWNNFGGNVNPGCSPYAGDGGNWNHISNLLNLHFQGRHIEVERCGNVEGIPPGSESPVTPFNFIEFTGTGTLKGIKGNKADFGTVYFFGRCEDRNEPGSNGQRDGAFKDRYFLNVYSNPGDPVGSSLLLVDVDGDPATVDPITITDGNLQIHITSCDAPAPTLASRTGRSGSGIESGAATDDAPAPQARRSSWGRIKVLYR